MRFQGTLIKNGAVVHTNVQGEYEVISNGGFTDYTGWLLGPFRSGESFRLKLDDGEEFGIMIGQVSHSGAGAVSHFGGNALAT